MWMRAGRTGGLLALLLAWGLSACGHEEPAPDPIVLGAVYNTTGAQAVLDVPSAEGSRLAVARINARGGVLGRPLRLLAVDGDTVPDHLATATGDLLRRHAEIVALLGLSDTDMLLAAAPVAVASGRIFLTSGATSPRLPAQVPEGLFLACFGDNVQAAAGAEWAHDSIGARSAAVLVDEGESYTRLLAGYFETRFQELGGRITAVQRVEPRAEDVAVPAMGPADLLFLAVETAQDAARVVPLIRAAGYAGPILGGDGYDAAEVWSSHGEITGVYFTTHAYLGPDNPRPEVRAFLAAYAEAHPGASPSAFAALGYDAVGLIAAAIEREGVATPEAVAKGLAGLSEYAGVTGTLSYPGDSRIPKKGVTILQVGDGILTHVADVVPESVPAP